MLRGGSRALEIIIEFRLELGICLSTALCDALVKSRTCLPKRNQALEIALSLPFGLIITTKLTVGGFEKGEGAFARWISSI